MKVVNRAGLTLKPILQRSDPFKAKRCDDNNSVICSTNGKGPCRAVGDELAGKN